METPPESKPAAWTRRPLVLGCGIVILLVLLIIGTTAATVWWIQRPIRPVVLTAQETTVVQEKVRELEGGTIPLGPTAPTAAPPAVAAIPDRTYTPGAKTLRLTEREINGLLNQNTDLGDKVRFEFARDAIHAYIAIPIPEDFPVAAGSTLRLRGRFRVAIGGEGQPYAILDDVTIFGLSLPKEWLGGIKGENLLGDAMGTAEFHGIKSLRVEPGELVIEVSD